MKLLCLYYLSLLLLGFFLSFFVFFCQLEVNFEKEVEIIKVEEKVDELFKFFVKVNYLVEIVDVKVMYDEGKVFKVIEISKKDVFEKGYLFGVVNFWCLDYEGGSYDYGGMWVLFEEMVVFLGSNGISVDDFLVIYDIKGSVDVICFMWMFDMYGYENMVVMNGGKVVWKVDGFELIIEVIKVDLVLYIFSNVLDYIWLASMEDVLVVMADMNYILLDICEFEEYQGVFYVSKGVCYLYKKGVFIYGCIFGFIYLNWLDVVDFNGDYRFKLLKDLKYNFEKVGIMFDKKVIVYCQFGVCFVYIIYVFIEILGFEDVKNYDGFWIEWSYNYINKGGVVIEWDIDDVEYKKWFVEFEVEFSKVVE